MIFPRISLHCELDPVQYREYEYGLLSTQQNFEHFFVFFNQYHFEIKRQTQVTVSMVYTCNSYISTTMVDRTDQ